MSESIIFRGAFIRHLDLRQGKEGGDVFTRIHVSAEFSDVVREKMEWEDPGDSITSAKLTGELLAQNFILTPGDKALKQWELQIAITDASDFQVVVLKDDDGEPSGRQLRFIVRSPGDGVEAQVGQYIRRVGRHEGQLKISYEPQAVQENLPIGKHAPKDGEEQACLPCSEGTPLRDGELIHTDLRPCVARQSASLIETETNSAPLASAVLLDGNRKRGNRNRQHNPEQEAAEQRKVGRDRAREAIADGTAPLPQEVDGVIQ